MMEITKPPAEYGDRFEFGAMAGATNAAAGIRGASVVMHAVQGCTIESSHLRSAGPVVAGYYLPQMETNMGPVESVHGQNVPLVVDRAKELMRRRDKPEMMFVFTGDGPSIIEDDIARAAAIIEEENGIPTIAIDTAAFLGGFARGIEWVLCSVLDRFCTASDIKEGINVVGPQLTGSNNWPNDIEEIKRLLSGAGVKLNHVLFQDISVKQLPEITKAQSNLLLTPEDYSQFEESCEDLGMGIFGQDLPIPLGVHNTEEWLLAIAEEFGDVDKARAQIETDMELVRKMTKMNYTASWMLTAMFGKHAAVLGHASFAAAMARSMFYDFNIRPVVVGLLAESPEALERAEKLLEPISEYLDIEVMENPTFFHYGEKVKMADVDFAVGMREDAQLIEGLGIPHLSLAGPNFMNHWDLIPWPYLGVRGSLYLTSELWKTIWRTFTQNELWQMNAYRPRDFSQTELPGKCARGFGGRCHS